MLNRLIKLLKEFEQSPEKLCPITSGNGNCDTCEYNIKGVGCYDVRRADYLLKNGVLAPPCKVGDTVYKPIITDDTHEPAIWSIEITQISIKTGKLLNEGYAIGKICKGESGESFDFDDIGKTVFLTKEEAEQELRKEEEGK